MNASPSVKSRIEKKGRRFSRILLSSLRNETRRHINYAIEESLGFDTARCLQVLLSSVPNRYNLGNLRFVYCVVSCQSVGNLFFVKETRSCVYHPHSIGGERCELADRGGNSRKRAKKPFRKGEMFARCRCAFELLGDCFLF